MQAGSAVRKRALYDLCWHRRAAAISNFRATAVVQVAGEFSNFGAAPERRDAERGVETRASRGDKLIELDDSIPQELQNTLGSCLLPFVYTFFYFQFCCRGDLKKWEYL